MKNLNLSPQRWQKYVTPLAVILAFYLLFQTLRIVVRNYDFQREADQISQEIEVLELENEQLRLNIQYYSTDEYLERAARDKLGLVAPGEKVLILPRNEARQDEPKAELPNTLVGRARYNFSQWMYFLFDKEPS